MASISLLRRPTFSLVLYSVFTDVVRVGQTVSRGIPTRNIYGILI